MENLDLDDQLRQYEQDKKYNWQRISFNLRRVHDIWSHNNLSSDWGQIKLSYWPVICNISIDGSTAGEIAGNSFVVKQNMSRTIKDLEDKGMITSKTSKKDKRSERLELTSMGKQFVCESMMKVKDLSEEYKKLVGEADLVTAVKVINLIIDYHKDHNDSVVESGNII
jgi:DNA-binding MarR family transcriptional regulator